MDTVKLTELASVVLALSIASERLVEIVKGLIPWLNKSSSDEDAEGRRCSVLQLLAVVSGVVTALLAKDCLPVDLIPQSANFWSILGLGLLASGGSGFWNTIVTYFAKIKDIKGAEAAEKIAVVRGRIGG
jgi:hypothetical protein